MQEIRNNCFGGKSVARPFVKRKQVNTGAVIIQQCKYIYHTYRILTYASIKQKRILQHSHLQIISSKKRVTLFRLETIVASFLHLMVLFYKVIINRTLRRLV